MKLATSVAADGDKCSIRAGVRPNPLPDVYQQFVDQPGASMDQFRYRRAVLKMSAQRLIGILQGLAVGSECIALGAKAHRECFVIEGFTHKPAGKTTNIKYRRRAAG